METFLQALARKGIADPKIRSVKANWASHTRTAGYGGTATAGYGGTATAGYGGEIRIGYHDGIRNRTALGYVGENGILPNVPYTCNNRGELTQCTH